MFGKTTHAVICVILKIHQVFLYQLTYRSAHQYMSESLFINLLLLLFIREYLAVFTVQSGPLQNSLFNLPLYYIFISFILAVWLCS